MQHKNDVLTNQRLINAAVAQFKSVFNVGEGASSFLYSSKHVLIQNKCGKASEKKGLPLQEYFDGLNFLFKELAKVSYRDQNLAAQLRMDLIRFISTMLNNALDTIGSESMDEPTLVKMLGYQMHIEHCIKEHFDEEFALPKPIDLSHIRKEYESSYEHYGRGVIGFFKQPFKLYFRQQTRLEELIFLERIESHCQSHANLSDEIKNSMRYTAAAMVLQSISSETFGEGSQLAKIIKARISQSKQAGQSIQIMDDFVEECRIRMIAIPEHIKKIDEKAVVDEINLLP